MVICLSRPPCDFDLICVFNTAHRFVLHLSPFHFFLHYCSAHLSPSAFVSACYSASLSASVSFSLSLSPVKGLRALCAAMNDSSRCLEVRVCVRGRACGGGGARAWVCVCAWTGKQPGK